MKTLFVLMFAVSLATQASAVVATQGGVFTKFRQLPVVQRVAEVWQGTGRYLARNTLALGMLTFVACGGITGCGEDDVVKDVSMADCGESKDEIVLKPEKSMREIMLANQDHYYSEKHIFFWIDGSGTMKRGRVIGYRWSSDADEYTFLVQSVDGSEEIIRYQQIAGKMFHSSPNNGRAVELQGDKVDERLTGIVTASYGYVKRWDEWEGNKWGGEMVERTEAKTTYLVVKLDSGEEVFVPLGKILAWLD